MYETEKQRFQELSDSYSRMQQRLKQLRNVIGTKENIDISSLNGKRSLVDELEELAPLKKTKLNDGCDPNVHLMEQKIHDLEAELKNTKKNAHALNEERKILLHDLMCVRGKIRVFCRMRPQLSNELNETPFEWECEKDRRSLIICK